MKTTINFNDFVRGFSSRRENFSHEGLETLFDYLEEFERDTGETIEFDPIALCCEYSEYKNLAEFQANYGDEYTTLEAIRDMTTVIPVSDDSFIIADF